MKSTSGTGKLLAIAGGSLVGVALAVAGCSDQYADMGTIDVSASKAKADAIGLKKFQPTTPKAPRSARGPAVQTEKTIEPPGRGAIPKS